MGKVPIRCRKCAAPCQNGCDSEERKKRSSQTHSDAKGKRGRVSDFKKPSRHVPAEPAERPRSTSPTQTDERRIDRELDEDQRAFSEVAQKNIDCLGNPRGRSRQHGEVVQFLYLMYKLQVAHQSGHLAEFAHRPQGADHRMYAILAGYLLGMGKDNSRKVAQTYADTGQVYVDQTPRGRASPNYILDDARKLQPQHLARIESFIAECHGKKGGGRVTIGNIKKDLLSTFGAEGKTRACSSLRLTKISRSAVRYALVHMLRYRWGKIRLKKINPDPERNDVIRTYLKAYGDALELERRGTHIIVYLDESYVHQNHAPTESWLKEGGDRHVERSSSKGKRVIILHAITNDGPLGGEDTAMTWNGDTPHPGIGEQTTAECLWVSASSSGDYHDNMNSKMFLQWVKNRLVPAFRAKYGEDKKMIVCMDNAPYHHARAVPSLSTVTTKASMLNDVIKKHTPNLTHLQLPIKEGTRDAPLQVPISDAMIPRATKNRPSVPTGDEMKESWLAAVKGSSEYAHLLECGVERYLQDEAKIVDKTMALGSTDAHPHNPLRLIGFLWTPPYTPTLQPIEEFWGCAKNYCASKYLNNRKVKECIAQLRVGWYGDGAEKPALTCSSLVRHAMEDADRRMKEVGGLTGSMATGVTIVTSDKTAVILPPDRMPTDMTHRHVEAVDLTQDDEEAPVPLTLSEDDHAEAQLDALEEGSVALVASEEEGPSAPEPPPVAAVVSPGGCTN